MDKTLIRRRFARAAGSYLQTASIQRNIAQHMQEKIATCIPAGCQRKVLEVGCGTGLFTRLYLQQHVPDTLYLNDICPEVQHCVRDVLGAGVEFLAGDAEQLRFPSGLDMLVSCSAIQWFERPADFLVGCRRLLKPESYLAFSTFGKKNMQEIASVSSVSLHYLSVDELKHKLEPHYRVVYAHEAVERMWFRTPMEVLKHLKETGVTGLHSGVWTKGRLEEFCRNYLDRYALPDGRIPLTYHPVYMICQLKK